MIRFRPHHFLCALGFEGKGYSDRFTANMHEIVVTRLRAPGGDATEISVTAHTDAICAPCPKRRGRLCVDQGKIARLDRAHGTALDLAAGEVITWGQAQDRMARLVPDDLDRICAGCRWLEMGMCKAALARLRQSRTVMDTPSLDRDAAPEVRATEASRADRGFGSDLTP
ncbi:DUF1284 domain-containing protein [Dinoroseobacter sp. PD6]|uniref:DUF1284 domain-containing protein n=1 Tax=Dinoroseobacter sp. PD6 TaxID=3028384 RepID=UPI00237ADEF8|nr:DUF1284 domain-containing protein [Dinoroseobacter sp. PD6]MDD9716616.1 DUF1284 domain-containing protein [Dinoroseobacter sp. PD6]